jgi:hypothetical protein
MRRQISNPTGERSVTSTGPLMPPTVIVLWSQRRDNLAKDTPGAEDTDGWQGCNVVVR